MVSISPLYTMSYNIHICLRKSKESTLPTGTGGHYFTQTRGGGGRGVKTLHHRGGGGGGGGHYIT